MGGGVGVGGLIFENAENSKQLSLGKRIYDHAYTTDLRTK